MSAVQPNLFRQQVRDWILTNKQPGVEVKELTDSTDLIASGVLDSVGFVQLLAFAESTLDRQIDFTDADTDTFTTLGGFIALALGGASPLTQQA